MEEKVKFNAANALYLPFPDKTFDGIRLPEIFRVLKPVGQAVLYVLCANKNTPLHFPVSWAQESSIFF